MRRKRRIHILFPLGCLIALAAFAVLCGTPRLIQYAFLPQGELGACAEKLGEVEAALDGAAPLTLHGVKSGSPVAVEEGASESSVTLYMVGERWNEVYPRRMEAGEMLSHAALSGKWREIVLDSELAFKLFGDRDPIGLSVDLSGERFEVVGVAEHRRRLGERTLYAAWIPLGSDEALGCDLMVATAVSGIDGGLTTLFENASREAFGEGELFGLMKERMRATMILRIIALVIAFRLLAIWLGVLKRVGGAWLTEYRHRLRMSYFRQTLGFALPRLLLTLLASAATLAGCWVMMNFFVQPVLVFVEWVPEVLVSFASIKGRFWELAGAASKPVRLTTAELAELRFWANILRWGVILALIGAVMTLLKGVFPKERMETR